jgi:Galactose oxidase, central domain
MHMQGAGNLPVSDTHPKDPRGKSEALFLPRFSFVTLFCSFGGPDGQYHYNDTWLFDISTRQWTELQCTGYIPSPREGHAAALVGDIMYIFGGRGVDGADLSDLTAINLLSE